MPRDLDQAFRRRCRTRALAKAERDVVLCVTWDKSRRRWQARYRCERQELVIGQLTPRRPQRTPSTRRSAARASKAAQHGGRATGALLPRNTTASDRPSSRSPNPRAPTDDVPSGRELGQERRRWPARYTTRPEAAHIGSSTPERRRARSGHRRARGWPSLDGIGAARAQGKGHVLASASATGRHAGTRSQPTHSVSSGWSARLHIPPAPEDRLDRPLPARRLFFRLRRRRRGLRQSAGAPYLLSCTPSRSGRSTRRRTSARV